MMIIDERMEIHDQMRSQCLNTRFSVGLEVESNSIPE